jgi:hypothetical protein
VDVASGRSTRWTLAGSVYPLGIEDHGRIIKSDPQDAERRRSKVDGIDDRLLSDGLLPLRSLHHHPEKCGRSRTGLTNTIESLVYSGLVSGQTLQVSQRLQRDLRQENLEGHYPSGHAPHAAPPIAPFLHAGPFVALVQCRQAAVSGARGGRYTSHLRPLQRVADSEGLNNPRLLYRCHGASAVDPGAPRH